MYRLKTFFRTVLPVSAAAVPMAMLIVAGIVFAATNDPAAVELRLVVALTNSRNSHRVERIQRRLPGTASYNHYFTHVSVVGKTAERQATSSFVLGGDYALAHSHFDDQFDGRRFDGRAGF
jgi:hypothetical protein